MPVMVPDTLSHMPQRRLCFPTSWLVSVCCSLSQTSPFAALLCPAWCPGSLISTCTIWSAFFFGLRLRRLKRGEKVWGISSPVSSMHQDKILVCLHSFMAPVCPSSVPAPITGLLKHYFFPFPFRPKRRGQPTHAWPG